MIFIIRHSTMKSLTAVYFGMWEHFIKVLTRYLNWYIRTFLPLMLHASFITYYYLTPADLQEQ
jgi:hypothetical protein